MLPVIRLVYIFSLKRKIHDTTNFWLAPKRRISNQVSIYQHHDSIQIKVEKRNLHPTVLPMYLFRYDLICMYTCDLYIYFHKLNQLITVRVEIQMFNFIQNFKI